MNAAEQIEMIARRTVATVTAESRRFSEATLRLATELGEHQQIRRNEVADLRTELQAAADACDTATPRILLPADMSEASPHRGRPNA
ncbi:hypothetical protein [Gordonia sp. NPDC003950]